MKLRAWSSFGLVFCLATLVVGACLTFLLFSSVNIPTLAAFKNFGETGVTDRIFHDDRTVEVLIEAGLKSDLLSPVQGRITSTDCAPGQSIISGSRPFSVDGQDLLALATEIPIWRDIAVGMEGADVLALQKELVRLGKPVTADGVLGRVSMLAIRDLLKLDSQNTTEILQASSVLWLPEASVTVESCTVERGSFVGSRDRLARFWSTVGSVKVTNLPTSLLAGQRTLTVGKETVDIDPSGSVPDVKDIERLVLASRNTLKAKDNTAAQTVEPGVLTLKVGAMVGVIPPSALYDVRTDSACVVSKGKALRIKLISSQLGESFIVSADDRALPDTVVISPEQKIPCS